MKKHILHLNFIVWIKYWERLTSKRMLIHQEFFTYCTGEIAQLMKRLTYKYEDLSLISMSNHM